jgi:glycosyltransferase involved in cell wall biosynthesis
MRIKIPQFEMPPLEKVDLRGLDLSGGISVFLPAYNEEENIERAVSRSVEVLSSITDNYEVLVVNDASKDRTAEIVNRMIAENPHIRMITHEKNTRLGGAIRTGFKNASKGYVFYCDADNPVDMWDVKRALPFMKDFDIVTGFRLIREERMHRLVYSWVYNNLTGTLFKFRARDINFSFKMVKRKVLQQVELQSDGGFIDVEFISEILRKGYKMGQVGVMYYPRTAGESTMASGKVIVQILKEMWAYYRRIKSQ